MAHRLDDQPRDARRAPPRGILSDAALPPAALPPAALQQSRAVFEPLDAWQPRALTVAEDSSMAAALASSLAASALLACEGVDQLFEKATDLARNVIGLERAAFYLREPEGASSNGAATNGRSPSRVLLRGTWGTGAKGESTDERDMVHELSPADVYELCGLRKAGGCALYRPRAPWTAVEGDRTVVLGSGWVMVTPLMSGNELIGVLYNDAALTRGAVDPGKQAAAAVLADVVSLEYVSRRDLWQSGASRSQGEPGNLVDRVRGALDEDLAQRGNELAVQFGVSSGHLARVFKREMGVSLVDYRNRRRLERFLAALQRPGGVQSLEHAAMEAGFGSYAQFCRVRKKFLPGKPGRDALGGGAARTEAAVSSGVSLTTPIAARRPAAAGTVPRRLRTAVENARRRTPPGRSRR